MAATFKDSFCACFQCKPEDFAKRALECCLYPHARATWGFLEFGGGPATLAAQAFMNLVADTRNKEELMDAVREYREDIRPHAGVLAKSLRFRVSVERLLGLHHFVREQEQVRAAYASSAMRAASNIYSGSRAL
jgi:hypothetical protein